MLNNNPNFVEKLVQVKQEEIERNHQGFNEQQIWNSNDPSNGRGTKSKLLLVVGALAALAGLVSLIG